MQKLEISFLFLIALSIYFFKASASEVTDTAEKDIEVPKVQHFFKKVNWLIIDRWGSKEKGLHMHADWEPEKERTYRETSKTKSRRQIFTVYEIQTKIHDD